MFYSAIHGSRIIKNTHGIFNLTLTPFTHDPAGLVFFIMGGLIRSSLIRSYGTD